MADAGGMPVLRARTEAAYQSGAEIGVRLRGRVWAARVRGIDRVSWGCAGTCEQALCCALDGWERRVGQ